MTKLPMRPIGMLRWGFLVSSAAVDTASKPTYAKNIEAAAPPMPSQPKGANGVKFSILMTGSASAQNSTKAATLMQTSTAFTVALSRVPSASSVVTSAAMNMAGTLMNPPAK